ncbi:MAG: thiamine-phosphate kinase [Gammaproteobacteria bacterium]
MGLSEFELIERYFSSGTIRREDVLVGIGDDAALLQVLPKHDIVSAMKTLVEGVHFERGAKPQALGHRVLAIALSRLAATGATPAWVTLSLALPAADAAWLARFSAAFTALAQRYQVQLVGGDTVCGPLSITVVASGFVPRGQALQRGGARAGDLIYVTGTLGEAGLALLAERGAVHLPQKLRAKFRARLDQPQPRVAEALALRHLATAAIDLPNGLEQGLGELVDASAVGATLYLRELPLLPETTAWLPAAGGPKFALHAGGDYELCLTIPAKHQAAAEAAFSTLDCGCTWIGMVETTPGLRCVLEDGSLNTLR